jgi:hypothetical protein
MFRHCDDFIRFSEKSNPLIRHLSKTEITAFPAFFEFEEDYVNACHLFADIYNRYFSMRWIRPRVQTSFFHAIKMLKERYLKNVFSPEEERIFPF